ncbi:hypothetical protein PVAND_000238 [Polypedilum vanderplanki]|uniref:Uncharacterized protein n=1 Tax=Polypedilum vanderplanki TaxID=319348 RepID=A0A9J6BJG6_POLVA|nr:hypothetical protein PVAND_000238 [Polypedilum vanderplanki]
MSCCDLPCEELSECSNQFFYPVCPPVCRKCNPHMSSCSCECCSYPDLPYCDPACCTSSPCLQYQRLRPSDGRPDLSKICLPPQCSLTPPRRQSFKPIRSCTFECCLPLYSTVYRKSFDVPTCKLPPY